MMYTLAAIFAIQMAVCFAQYPDDAGFIQVDADNDANLYYYFLKSQGNPATDPLVLWLQGGPGCSSLFGLYVENGPQLMNTDGATFTANPYPWNSNANLLYIDSPVGTGFSYVNNDDYPSDEQTIAHDLYTALHTFLFQLHPELKMNPFYIFGESYAGKYIPWLGSTVLAYNANSTDKINLKGLGIGDGYVNPLYIVGSWAPFLQRNGLLDQSQVEDANQTYAQFVQYIQQQDFDDADQVGNSLLNTLMDEANIGDVYDIRKSSDPTQPYQDALATWLNDPNTISKLNANNNGQGWQACATGPYFALEGDMEQSSAFLIPNILTKIPVLLYNGNYDLICDIDGTTWWSNQMVWPLQNQYQNAVNHTWVVKGQTAGWYRGAGNLMQLGVFNAGHMVPFDQPQNSQVMLYQFIAGGFKP